MSPSFGRWPANSFALTHRTRYRSSVRSLTEPAECP